MAAQSRDGALFARNPARRATDAEWDHAEWVQALPRGSLLVRTAMNPSPPDPVGADAVSPEPVVPEPVVPEPVASETINLILHALQRSAKNVGRGAPADTDEAAEPRVTNAQGRAIQPDLIPGYRIVRHLGRGGMANVYEAVHLRLRRTLALKVLILDDEQRELVPRFLREARVMMQVRHPNVTTIHDLGSAAGLHYIALELITGGDLAARIDRGGPLPVDQAITLMIACSDGLAAIHVAGMIHRDIKPANIFLTAAGEPKIGDFGLARHASGADRMTVTGACWGTPSYMAPEQITSEADVDARADIYALGAAFYTMLTGREPFSGSTAYLTTFKAMTESFPDPRAVNPLIPASIAAIIRTATAHERDERYSSARKLREDLLRAQRQAMLLHTGSVAPLADPTLSPLPAVHRQRGPRPVSLEPRGRSPMFGWRGALLVGVAGASIAWWWPGKSTTAAEPAFPAWATGSGRDAAGRWIELSVGEAITRLRHRPAGTFRMGSPPAEAGRSADETEHLVSFSGGFWIQETECDQAFYSAVTGTNPSRHRGADLPVEQVTWDAAQDFCAQLLERGVPARLPTEAEWEYACRAGSEASFSQAAPAQSGWMAGGELEAIWHASDGGESAAYRFCADHPGNLTMRAHPVARLLPNAAGLYDLHGNVQEWCADRWDGTTILSSLPVNDPRADNGHLAVARGGSWFHPQTMARSAARVALPPDTRLDHLGFRFVISDEAATPARP